ncbi:Inositol transporter 4 Myo-inositol-proton symporter INT4 Protein INOSITOL TRANSPORTER 4 [Vigna angularis]|uniref:Inositol transporter 4 Myo-inositol-proton symporter INT4 Protein INOSITOL TRANSPORTER 4 n=1 Tax=Phaseolus angularis TaxID=3914 RepID=A0A8T0L4G5_PHAAN|nr:Inositol transporter 4 Myo-inositol-proton symporter INT4 Protein INOSITOL TRANSPORTER 4 [Vigna angularis]
MCLLFNSINSVIGIHLVFQGKEEEARNILLRIYRQDEIEEEMRSMQESVQAEKEEHSNGQKNLAKRLKDAFSNDVVRRGLYAGITVQVAQQFVGINTLMYYSPTIVQFAGIASNSTALALSLITSGLNAVGTVMSMAFIDRYGRRRLMLISLVGIIVCLVVSSAVFFQAAKHAPAVSDQDTLSFGTNSTCQPYINAPKFPSWNCMQCLHEDCAFCANSDNEVGSSNFLVSHANTVRPLP